MDPTELEPNERPPTTKRVHDKEHDRLYREANRERRRVTDAARRARQRDAMRLLEATEAPTTPMTSKERSDLAALIRRREKVAKAQATEVRARRVAEFEAQLASVFSAQDEAFRDLTDFAQRLVERANRELQVRCDTLGIPPAFRPSLDAYWRGRGENAASNRRSELRKVAQTQADADLKAALYAIEARSVEAQTELLRDGLTSSAAQQWLEAIPTPDALLPHLNVDSLLKALPDHRNDPMLSSGFFTHQAELSDAFDKMLREAPFSDASSVDEGTSAPV